MLLEGLLHNYVIVEFCSQYTPVFLQHFLDQDDVASLGMDTADLPSSKKGSKNSATVYPAPTIQHTANKVKVSSNCYADSIFIKVENLSASWSHNPTKLVLQNIHFELNEVSTW